MASLIEYIFVNGGGNVPATGKVFVDAAADSASPRQIQPGSFLSPSGWPSFDLTGATLDSNLTLNTTQIFDSNQRFQLLLEDYVGTHDQSFQVKQIVSPIGVQATGLGKWVANVGT